MSSPSSTGTDPPRVECGDIFKAPPRKLGRKWATRTNLTHGAWGHMVLVLGPKPSYPGYWRIMTVTTKVRNQHDFIPFHPVGRRGYAMQLAIDHTVGSTRRRFKERSYLRIGEEFWIEDAGLVSWFAQVPLQGHRGLNRLLQPLEERSEDEMDEEEDTTDEGEESSDEDVDNMEVDADNDDKSDEMPAWARQLMNKMDEMNERLAAIDPGLRCQGCSSIKC